MSLPVCKTLLLETKQYTLHITFNRPEVRNALSLQTVGELMAVFEAARNDPSLRTIVLRGAGGHFCAGGDIRDMARARQDTSTADPIYDFNRTYGRMLEMAEQLPQLVVCVLEGAVMGGGFGLACISDMALTHQDARFALPETGLGIPPAQIAPFVVKRIGLTQARRLALLGEKINGHKAVALGIAHEVYDRTETLEIGLQQVLSQLRFCAPEANALTKRIILSVNNQSLSNVLDDAARDFSRAIQGKEGQEGAQAFMNKRKPAWVE